MDYDKVRLLGEGSTSVVFYGERKIDRKPCVIKVFQQGFDEAQSDQPLARFERECKALSALSHRVITKIIEWGSSGSFPYIVMAYEKGEALGAYFQKGSAPIPVKKILAIISALAQALAHAHDRQIIRRDIKPENILLKEDGTPLLIDFGLVSSGLLQTYRTATGVILGSPPYMAPELFGTERASAQTDLYALVLVLYELITRKRAFKGSLNDVISKKLKGQQPRLTSSSLLPSAFTKVVNGILARKLKMTATEFQKELEKAQQSLAAAPARATIPMQTTAKRPMAVYALVVFMLLGPLVWLLRRPQNSQVPPSLESELSLLAEKPMQPQFSLLQKYLWSIEKLCQQAYTEPPAKRRQISKTLEKLNEQTPKKTTLSAIIKATIEFQGPNKHRALLHYKEAFHHFKRTFAKIPRAEQAKQLPLSSLLAKQIIGLKKDFKFLEDVNRFYFRLPKEPANSLAGRHLGEMLARLSHSLFVERKFFFPPYPKGGRSLKERVREYQPLYAQSEEMITNFNDDAVHRLATYKIDSEHKPTKEGNAVLHRLVNLHWLYYEMLPHPQCPPGIRQQFIGNCMDIAGYFGKFIHFSTYMDKNLWGPHLNERTVANRGLDQLIFLTKQTGGEKSTPAELLSEVHLLHGANRWLIDMRTLRVVLGPQFEELVQDKLHRQNAVFHHVQSVYRLHTLGSRSHLELSKQAVALAKKRIDEYSPTGKVVPQALWMVFDLCLRHRFDMIIKSGSEQVHIDEIEGLLDWFKPLEIEGGMEEHANLWSYALVVIGKGQPKPLADKMVSRLVAAKKRCTAHIILKEINRLLGSR